jgi:hypothetical protein
MSGLWSLISSGSIGSALNSSENGVKLVAQQTIVLWLHTTLDITSAHLLSFHLRGFFWLLQILRHLLSLLLCLIADDIHMQRRPSYWLGGKNPWHVIAKVFGVVNNDLLWDSIATDNILLEKLFNSQGGYVGDWLRFNPFHEVFHCHNGKGVIALCWSKFADNVDAPPL